MAALALLCIGALAPLGLLGAFQPGMLMMLPALLLAVALLAGRYPGERLIERWSRGRSRGRGVIANIVVPARPTLELLRGGRLLAARLAGRAPPVLAAS
ncbi:MAG: hypothetical protein ABSG64_02570 [Solirubrobacteraceae bacterium]